ncbi:epidermal growth factor receptor kinase substrate 8-like protein 3b [Leuresthes tenuis]|uniref:epidermal growth factor receptor kinase substrate 8-like protein 3b n=1 Tax=Leuresthes tenuis TaxID=355514 RepID=UPI003B50C41E
MTRPSGRAIYMQRKEYAETLSRQPDNFQVRVEHLLTCELDGQELKTVDDCLAKLKRLDSKGRLWPQEMIMEIQGAYLRLSDIETKVELESIPLSCIMETKAVLDSCVYNSLLTLIVQERNKSVPQVFMFQCEETGAGDIKTDLDKAAQGRGDNPDPYREQFDVRNNLENIIGQQASGSFYRGRPRPVQQPMTPPPLDHNVQQRDNMESAPSAFLPHWDEYVSCLQKIKYGFNLLGQLDGVLGNPSASDYVHIFFDNLNIIVRLYQPDLPPTVVSPLLTDTALQLLDRVVSEDEEYLWRSLGDSWFTPRSNWPEDVPPYIPQFYDGWLPPAPPHIPSSLSHQNGPLSRNNSQRFPGGGPVNEGQSFSPRVMHWQPEELEEPMANGPRSSRPGEEPLQMRVIYDFMARNNRELSIMKGEVVQVIQKSRQWWLVRNSQNEEGNVPQNVLEPLSSSGPTGGLPQDTRSSVTLNMRSSPAEVRAWLEQRGFSKITVSTLGVLTGDLLLGMSKDEIRTVCPEEAGKVFFQLQAVKSSIALASEPSGMYNGRY